MTLESRNIYKRLTNGMDVCIIPTQTRDVVVCNMAFPGGTHATYDNQAVALLVGELMPSSTKKRARSTIREAIDALGAHVSITETNEHLMVSIRTRSATFLETLAIVVEVLTTPSFKATEFKEARARLDAVFDQLTEDTSTQASISVSQLLYKQGHPHWIQDTKSARKDLQAVTLSDVKNFYASTLSATDTRIVIAGDVKPTKLHAQVASILASVPETRPTMTPETHSDRTLVPKNKDVILSMKDKMNIDTQLMIPLAITLEHPDHHALIAGVQVLGSSSTGRLFQSLRTKQSLTYGAYASLAGIQDGYAGYIAAQAIFPNDVFVHARTSLRNEVKQWATRGITANELTKKKEEISGRYKVGLSTTKGIASAVFSALLTRRAVSYIDEYPNIMQALTLREVNSAVKAHVHYDLAVTAAAGAIDTDGKPLN